MNYRDLAENVARIAGALRKRGFTKGQVVAIELQPELEAVMILACAWLGAVSLSASPLLVASYKNHIDATITAEATSLPHLPTRIIINQTFMQELGAVAKLTEPEAMSGDDLVRLSFSSGTTGVPKAIPFTAARIPLRTESAHQNWMQAKPGMSLLGLDTITGIIALFWAVTSGNTFFVSKSPSENLELIKRYGIKAIETSPAKLKDLLGSVSGTQVTHLQQILVAGSLMSKSLADQCQEVLGLIPSYLYGSTEVGAATVDIFNSEETNRLGRLVGDVELQIVDDQLQVLPANHVGNIRYRKSSMPMEYWHSKSSAMNGFVDGWFYSGDRGWLDDDQALYLEGRNDDLVNAAGNKFNLLALDLWLLETGLFDDVASFAYETPSGTQIGLAFVTQNPPEPQILVQRIQSFLPNLQIDHLLRLSALPRNKMDKVDRKELKNLIEGINA
jgi:acyl-coenzyme A synthetase/AMP-(fatty) acid ligase